MTSTAIAYTEDIELPRYRLRLSTSSQVESTNSSAASSIKDDCSDLPPPYTARKTLNFSEKWWKHVINIHNASSTATTPIYQVDTAEFNCKKPDVVLRIGNDEISSHTLAVAYFRWSRHLRMGLGDPIYANDVTWEEMRNTSTFLGHSRYQFSFTEIPSTSSTRQPLTRHFRWQRTRDPLDGVTKFWSKMCLRNYKLIDLTTSEVLAIFVANTPCSFTTNGQLRIFADLSRSLETMVILSCVCIEEKGARRNRRHARRCPY